MRVARNLQWGGGRFWRLETTSNDFDPDFDQSSFRLSRFFCPKIKKKGLHTDWVVFVFFVQIQVISKKQKNKKGLQPCWSPAFLVEITSGPWPILIANGNGGRAIFVFSAKIGLKSTKNGVFCILFRPMGETIPPHPPFLATLLQVTFLQFFGFLESSFNFINTLRISN